MTTKTRTQPLGKKLMKMRRERNMTVQHLANETGLGVQYHRSGGERGDHSPRGRDPSDLQGTSDRLQPASKGGKTEGGQAVRR